jgi:hypothetical protein
MVIGCKKFTFINNSEIKKFKKMPEFNNVVKAIVNETLFTAIFL